MMYVRVTSALAAATLLTLVSYAQAQSLPPQGELHVTFTATQEPPAKPMPIGDGKQYVQVNLIMSAVNDQGNPILNNMGGRCQLTRLVDDKAKTYESHGYSAYTDADNDQIFEKCDSKPRFGSEPELMRADRGHGQIPRSASISRHHDRAGQEYL